MGEEQDMHQSALAQALEAMRTILREVDQDGPSAPYSADSYLPEHMVAMLRAAVIKSTEVLG